MKTNIELDQVVTREQIESLVEGDIVPNCFGKPSAITRIYARGNNLVDGKAYVLFYVRFGYTAEISGALREGNKPEVVNG